MGLPLPSAAFVFFSLIVGMLVAVITLPIWGPFLLRSLKKIQSGVRAIRQTRESCGADHACPFHEPSVDEIALAARSRLGPRLALLYCLDRRLTECLDEWSADAMSRMFQRFCYGLLAFIILSQLKNLVGLNGLVNSYLKNMHLDQATTGTLLVSAMLASMSGSEVLTVLEIRGRYKELSALSQQMLKRLV